IAAGQIISIQSGNTVIQNVIRSVNSDTELVLAFAPSINLNNAKYVISTTVPDTVSDGVRHMVAINAYIIQFLQNMDRWMSENGKVEVEMPNGQKVTLDSIRALQAAVEGKLNKSGGTLTGELSIVQNSGRLMRLAVDNSTHANYFELHGGSKLMGWFGFGTADDNKLTIGNTKTRNYLHISDDLRFNDRRVHVYGAPVITEKSNLDNYRDEGVYVINNDGVGSNFPEKWGGTLIVYQGPYNRICQVYYIYGATTVYRRASNHENNFTSWVRDWNTGNATFDNNGFLKKTSPIIQIYPEGQFETNDESEGATVTKLGLGHYKLSGILGYNADGAWGVHGGISVPRDVNGNELVYVEDKVLPDGAIEIKVTHRQNAHMPARLQNRRMKSVDEQTHYTDDEPCDLPAGTRLDVRVQMPEDSIWNQKQVVTPDPQQKHSVTSAVNK
ncbi:pyocin knob domain-containing protein, partial [Xenorhabdus bovienii]|uniref:pyocin knob domain-containing protein n=1 Tax=Xenorhabdus bovienii TaxID=40576 RepID=UPI0023B32E07